MAVSEIKAVKGTKQKKLFSLFWKGGGAKEKKFGLRPGLTEEIKSN